MTSQPNLLPIFGEKPNTYQLAHEWTAHVGLWRITVPAGFILDCASVPRLLWWIIPPDGLHRPAATAHDWLYAVKGRLDMETLSREECDHVFHRLLTEWQVPRAAMMHAAVRLFGWRPWSRSTGRPRVEPLRYTMS